MKLNTDLKLHMQISATKMTDNTLEAPPQDRPA